MPDNGYFRAKLAQEEPIEASGIPHTIIRATQFLSSSPASPLRVRTATR